MPETGNELRRRIEEQKIGAQVPDNIWRELLALGAVEKVVTGAQTEDWLTDRVLNLAPGVLRTKADPMLSRRQIAEREEMLSHFVANHAAADDAVQKFRHQAFGERGLLSPEQVVEWVNQQARDATFWLEIALPAGFSPVRTANGIGLTPALTISKTRPVIAALKRRFLEYAHPDGWRRNVPTQHGSVLDQLRQLSEDLAARYGWQPAQATNFVLTGQTPLVRAIKADWTRTGRLVLNVDAAIGPQQLVTAYRALRRRLIGGRRARALTEHQQQLAKFLATRPSSESWAERRRAWNRTHQREAYEPHRAHNFKRACENVARRLLHPLDENIAAELFRERIERVSSPGKATTMPGSSQRSLGRRKYGRKRH